MTEQITANFNTAELTASRTATRMGIDNTPDAEELENLRMLTQTFLQPVRNHFGCPVVITSGYRCQELNQAVGGVPDSLHLTGQAADFWIADGPKPRQCFFAMRKHSFPCQELIWYESDHRFHVACTGENDQQYLVERGGEYVPADSISGV